MSESNAKIRQNRNTEQQLLETDKEASKCALGFLGFSENLEIPEYSSEGTQISKKTGKFSEAWGHDIENIINKAFATKSKHISSPGRLGYTPHQPVQKMYQISHSTENDGSQKSPLWSRKLPFSSANKYSTSLHYCRQEMVECAIHRMKTMRHLKDFILTSPDRALNTKQTENLYLKRY